jgi:outer membrane protease
MSRLSVGYNIQKKEKIYQEKDWKKQRNKKKTQKDLVQIN